VPKFSATSQKRLEGAHPDLQRVFAEVVKHFDCTIVCGHRGRVAQQLALESGKSKAAFGQSPHNFKPAYAVDVVPYPINWQDRERMTYFAGFVLGTARALGVNLKWGGDWDGDTHLSDNRFDDLPHFELAEWRQHSLKEDHHG